MSNPDFYCDDPANFNRPKSKKRVPGVLALIAALIGGTFYIQTTLAANISLNSGSVEFGQGILRTVACSGSQSLTITPLSSFANASGAGSYKFSGIRVDNIPTSCQDTDFAFSAYNNVAASAAQAIFNTSSTRAVVYMTSTNTFEVGIGGTGLSVATNSSSSFTLTFTTPVAPTSDVNNLTVESAAHTRPYIVGNTGPGGGLIYYVDNAGFSCGATYASTGSPTGGLCHYLEAAPSGWNTGSDPGLIWAVLANWSSDVIGITNDASAYNNPLGVGLGYQNSIAIVDAGNDTTTAAGAARAFAGGSKSDWYLPSAAELNLLCQWVRGVSPSVATTCTGGTLNSGAYGADSAGFGTEYYWSSSEVDSGKVWWQYFNGGNSGPGDRNEFLLVRPIRAF